jgi:hypothetical protein
VGEQKKQRIVFHIGLERTGTTSFQRFCHEHRDELLEHGVLYPTRSLGFSQRSRNHAPLVAAYLHGTGHVDLNLAEVWRTREEILPSLRAEIARAQAPAVLVSAEHFSSRLYPREVGLLATDFADCDCRVVIVLRGHEARVCSAYSSTIKAGRTLTVSEFIEELMLPGNSYIRYAETIGRWEQAFGRAHVSVLQLAEGGDSIGDLLRLVAPDLRPENLPRYADNASYGRTSLEALRRLNAELPQPDGTARNALRLRLAAFARTRLLKSFTLAARREQGERLRLNAAQRAMIKEIVETDRDWLERNYDIDLIEAPPLSEADEESQEERRASELLANVPWADAAWLWLGKHAPF